MKPITRVISLALCAILLLGCAAPKPLPEAPSTENTPKAPEASKNNEVLTMPTLLGAKPLLVPDFEKTPPEAGSSANEFAFKLSKSLFKKGENSILSPFSVWMTLAALSNATNAKVLPELLKSINAEGLSVKDINESVSRMLYMLTGNEGKDANSHNPLAIANAIFVDKSVALKEPFAQAFLDFYRGAAQNVDFLQPSSIDAINKWASEHTNGLITDIVKEIPRDTIAALANAIYFSDRWALEFNEAETEGLPFKGTKSEAKAKFMKREGDAIPYYEDASLQAVNLEFVGGGGLLIMLPKDKDADALFNGMNADSFKNILDGIGPNSGKLLMPRFELFSDFELKEALEGLGVPLFDSMRLPLNELADVDAFISAALHQATITVDEKGTTAAAVTVQMMSRTSLPSPTEPFSMVCDRPFAFVLHKWTPEAGAQVLFTGVVNQM